MFHNFRWVPDIPGTTWNHADKTECTNPPSSGQHHCSDGFRVEGVEGHTAVGNTPTKRCTRPSDRSLQTYDFESLLDALQTTLFQERRTNNPIIVTISLCALPIISILCFILYSHTRYGRYCVWKTDDTTVSTNNHPEPEDAQGETQGHSVLFT